jgi:hypothetical protein
LRFRGQLLPWRRSSSLTPHPPSAPSWTHSPVPPRRPLRLGGLLDHHLTHPPNRSRSRSRSRQSRKITGQTSSDTSTQTSRCTGFSEAPDVILVALQRLIGARQRAVAASNAFIRQWTRASSDHGLW